MGKKSSGAYIIDSEYNIVSYNDTAERLYPQLQVGEKCYHCLMNLSEPCPVCPVYNRVEGPRTYLDPIRNIYETVDAVELRLADGSVGHALVFTTVGISEKMSQQLPNDEMGLRLVSILNVLGENYENVYAIDRETGSVEVYRFSGKARGVKEVLTTAQDMQYSTAMATYIDQNVLSEDQMKMTPLINLENVCEHLKMTQQFGMHYRVRRDGETHFYFMKCARIGDDDDFDTIVMGFGNEDFDIRRKLVEAEIAPGGTATRRKLLVIEDNEMNREILKELLSDTYDVVTAQDGEEGFRLLSDMYQILSAVLLDIYMPRCDGFEFLERTRSDKRLQSVPVIVTTSSERVEDEARSLELGAVDFIKKPYNANVVRAKLNSVIRLRESAMALAAIEYDELTGLYTRQAFFHHASTLLSAKPDRAFHVIVCDIKNFKLINSIYGEKKGDEILIYLSRWIEKIFPDAVSARYGSDQFVCLTYGTKDFSDQMVDSVTSLIANGAPIPNLRVNYGIYQNVDTELPMTIICDRAITAMKSVHDSYERCLAFYDDEMDRRHIYERRMEDEFEQAIENHEFILHFQPKIDVQTERITGAEALVRWRRQDGTLIPPKFFIPLFERDGLIQRLDEYVFREVCRLQRICMENHELLLPVSINLSRATLHQVSVLESYSGIVKENQIPLSCVPIELTETAALQSIRLKGMAEQMSQAGFHLQMDDFGTGYSSMTSLNLLPFDEIKLDKSLIDFVEQPKGRQIVRHTIALAHCLGMQVLCEGVETKEQVDYLRMCGCDEIQGFYYAMPLEYDSYRQMVAERNSTDTTGTA